MDRERVDTLLDTIDGALRDPVGPDAMRWVPEDDRTEEDRPWEGRLLVTFEIDTGPFIAAMERMRDQMAAALGPALVRLSEAAKTAHSATAALVADSERDRRQHALHLRRTRNTGPQQNRRAPRRIDPRRGRT